MAAIYAKNYTAQELGKFNAFYQTSVGQKTVQLMPQLAAHIGELKIMVETELKKINAAKNKL